MRSAALRAAPAAPPRRGLDPVEINSNGHRPEPGGNPQLRPVLRDAKQRVLERGHYRRQYRDHARVSSWGTEKQGCGCSVLVRLRDGHVEVRPVLCDTWGCPICGVRRAAWLKKHVQQSVWRYRLIRFWTLTVSTQGCTAAQSYRVVKAAWNRLHAVLRKHYGAFSYVWVRETTQRGYAHLHVLTSLTITQRELKNRWFSASRGSHQAKVEGVTDEGAANYLAKYVSQEATERRRAWTADGERDRNYGKSGDVRFPCFRCGEEHPTARKEGGKVVHVPCPRPDDYVAWLRWAQPYKEAVELLERVARVERAELAGVPAAVLSADGIDDLVVTCEQVAAAAEEERAAWPERDEVDDSVGDVEQVEDMDALYAVLNHEGVVDEGTGTAAAVRGQSPVRVLPVRRAGVLEVPRAGCLAAASGPGG